MSSTLRLRLVAACTGWGLAVAVWLTRPLWMEGSRFYPTTPVSGLLPDIPEPLDTAIWAALILAGLATALLPRLACIAAAAIYFGYSLFDQQRWIPFFNEIGALLLVLAVHRRWEDEAEARDTLNTCGIVIALVYLWSGIQKFNYHFYVKIFPWMMSPFLGHLPAALVPYVLKLAVAVPFVETFLGIALLSRRWRPIGIVVAAGMHTFILASVGPFGLGGNVQVWFWNIASTALVVLIFAGLATPAAAMLALRGRPLRAALVVFFGLAPVLNMVAVPGLPRWDDFQAATLYSGNECQAKVSFDAWDLARVPEDLRDIVTEGADGRLSLDIKDWAYLELNVPDYHALRIHLNAARTLCRAMGSPPGVVVATGSKSNPVTGARKITEFRCRDLGA